MPEYLTLLSNSLMNTMNTISRNPEETWRGFLQESGETWEDFLQNRDNDPGMSSELVKDLVNVP
jgi:hypothetical protein